MIPDSSVRTDSKNWWVSPEAWAGLLTRLAKALVGAWAAFLTEQLLTITAAVPRPVCACISASEVHQHRLTHGLGDQRGGQAARDVTARRLSQPPVTPPGAPAGPRGWMVRVGASFPTPAPPQPRPPGPLPCWLAPGLTGMLFNQFLQRHRHLLSHSAGLLTWPEMLNGWCLSCALGRSWQTRTPAADGRGHGLLSTLATVVEQQPPVGEEDENLVDVTSLGAR